MDVNVYAGDPSGPYGRLPGEMIFHLGDLDPGPVGIWPEVSAHVFEVNQDFGSTFWVGWWGNCPGELHSGPFMAYDYHDHEEDWTRSPTLIGSYYPGPHGWWPVSLLIDPCCTGVCRIRVTVETKGPTAVEPVTWGRIESLWR